MARNKLIIRNSRPSGGASTSLLKTVLETPHLPQVLERMNPLSVAQLVKNVGVEDCGDIVECMSPELLRQVLEEDLWRAEQAGQPEKFDLKQAIRWLHIWNEMSPEVLCSTLTGLGLQFVAAIVVHFAYVRELSGMAWDLLDLDGYGSILNEEEMPFRHIFESFDLLARKRDPETWRLFLEMMTTLWEGVPNFLLNVLGLCCNRSQQDEYDFERQRHSKVDEVEELLRDELSHARELRRRLAGFLDPEQSRDLLRRVRQGCAVSILGDFLAQKVIVSAPDAESAAAQPEDGEPNDKTDENVEDAPHRFAQNARTAKEQVVSHEILKEHARKIEQEVVSFAAPVALIGMGEEDKPLQRPIVRALRTLQRNVGNSMPVQAQLAGLANLMVAGCNVGGRKFEREEAFEAVLSVVDIGLGLEKTSGGFPSGGPLQAFQDGLCRLHNDIAMPVALAFDRLIRSKQPEHEFIHRRWIQACLQNPGGKSSFAQLMREGLFFEMARFLRRLEPALPGSVLFCLVCMMSEFPVIPKGLGSDGSVPRSPKDWTFVASESDFARARKFAEHLEDVI